MKIAYQLEVKQETGVSERVFAHYGEDGVFSHATNGREEPLMVQLTIVGRGFAERDSEQAVLLKHRVLDGRYVQVLQFNVWVPYRLWISSTPSEAD